ncbi:TPA: hypothetical protein N0F65_012456 [Lagenidium giganteum]|uniref:CBM1 domain-containing protein n=1 Tax=Lagenidium giganteum TaxID=4803 RepID=A0AAV2YD21_9STRA|nr:TPA: hypothetical protein N0F65_012456 [Lagenidium giganteum]
MKPAIVLTITSAITAVSAEEVIKVPVWGQCKWEGKPALKCEDGLMCAVQSEYYGQCVSKEAELWGQCNGKNWPEAAKCKKGMCAFVNGWYSQCKPARKKRRRQRRRKSKDGEKPGLWGQCKGEGWQKECDGADMSCIVHDQYYGQCLKVRNIDLWHECGGKYWLSRGECAEGSCQEVNADYWQCKP